MSETVQSNMAFKDRNLYMMFYTFLMEKNIFLWATALLLGRAVILFELSPFALPFFAACMVYGQKRLSILSFWMIIGACTYSIEQAIFIVLSLSLFVFLMKLLPQQRQTKWVMTCLFIAMVAPRFLIHMLQMKLTIYHGMSFLVEACLALILWMIFTQSMALFSFKSYTVTLKNEEVISIIILLASILTGFIGWNIYDVSLASVFARWIVLVIACVGGAAIGATVGVVTGLILSLANITNLYEMSLLAFAGLLGGLLYEGKKFGTSSGLLIGTLLVSAYGEIGAIGSNMMASIVAVCLFYMMPKQLLYTLSKYIPGTAAYTYEERKHLQKMRDVTAKRVEQYSDVFEALSESFLSSSMKEQQPSSLNETDYFLSFVTEKTCQNCFMKQRCWVRKFEDTYVLMENMKDVLLHGGNIHDMQRAQFDRHCVKATEVIEVMKDEISLLSLNKQLKEQVAESKKIVADQLQGVSQMMDNFAKEIVKERHRHEQKEIEIVRALQQMHISLEKIDIYQLEKGNIDMELALIFHDYHGEGAKVIAPLLSHVLNETIVVEKEEISPFPNGVSFLTFRSAKQYTIETGVATAAKGGGLISGDCHLLTEVGKGKYALAISDGMGNGLRAREESSETLRLLKQLLQTGISESVAIESINSILALRTSDEIFATLDLAIVNLQNASLRFVKIGSVPSFLKRGNEVIQIDGSSLPIGIIQQVEVDMIQQTLKQGDIVIMMSDGLYDGIVHVTHDEKQLQQKIAQIETDDPQHIADLLLEDVVRDNGGMIRDDMTVVVFKIDKYRPKWKPIPVMEQIATS